MSNINTLLLRIKYALESLENEDEQKRVVERVEAFAAHESDIDIIANGSEGRDVC